MKSSRKKKFIASIFMGNLILVIIPVSVAAFLINYAFHSYMVNDLARKDEMMLFHVKQNVESFLCEATDTLEYVNLVTGSRSGAGLNNEIERINDINSYFENIEILDTKGLVVNTLPTNADQIGHTRSGESYFSYLAQKGGIYWSVPFISSVSGDPTVTVAIKREGRIIVGYLNLDHFSLLTDKLTEADPDLKASILDSYGIYISSNNIDSVRQRQLEPNFSEVKKSASTEWPNRFIKTSRQIGVSIKTETPEWYIVVYDDFTHSMQNVDALLNLFLFIILASVFIFTILTLLRSSRIDDYISQFLRQTEVIASGKFDVNFPGQRYSEFEKLAEHFRVMAGNLKDRDRELSRMAYIDSLTGTMNRAYLYLCGWQDCIENANEVGMVYLDIDNFKNINDSYGHIMGDDLLIEVSARLRDCVAENAILARLGGDEFVIIISDGGNALRIDETLQKIADAFKRPVLIGERSFFVTVSMGVSVSKRENFDFNSMLKSADIAMYQAKSEGKNNYKFYNPEMDQMVRRRLLVEQNLRSALEENELKLVYQPLILAKTGRIRGFEALLRWENKELGFVSPLEFIPVAEETGMIVKIGEWVLKTSCKTIREINELYGTDYIMSVNISPVEIRNPLFIGNLYEIIRSQGVKNEWLEIEITESVFLSNIEQVISVILRLTSSGISVSLDDFGTGYSSLSYLNRLPIDTLKIDREFIRDLIHNKNNQKMVDSIILLAHNLGIFLVAEGVENQNQVQLLNDYSCDCIQGFYFSKPLNTEDLLSYIETEGSGSNAT